MMEASVNYISLIENLIRPLIQHPDDLRIKEFPSEAEYILFQVMVNEEDLGRGKYLRDSIELVTVISF